MQAKPIPRLMEAIMKYDKHVTIYRILKKCGKSCDCPRNFDAEYPEEFKYIIKSLLSTSVIVSPKSLSKISFNLITVFSIAIKTLTIY